MVDDYRNLIYIHRTKHKVISRGGSKNVVLSKNPLKAIFSDFQGANNIEVANNKDALYTRDESKIAKIAQYNSGLPQSIFEFMG